MARTIDIDSETTYLLTHISVRVSSISVGIDIGIKHISARVSSVSVGIDIGISIGIGIGIGIAVVFLLVL